MVLNYIFRSGWLKGGIWDLVSLGLNFGFEV